MEQRMNTFRARGVFIHDMHNMYIFDTFNAILKLKYSGVVATKIYVKHRLNHQEYLGII